MLPMQSNLLDYSFSFMPADYGRLAYMVDTTTGQLLYLHSAVLPLLNISLSGYIFEI